MAYKKDQPCSACGTITVEAYVNLGYGFFCKRYTCPKCNQLTERTTKCQYCGDSITYLVNGNYEHLTCNKCQKKLDQPGKQTIKVQRIPSWRLAMDDATPDEVTTLPSTAFGMPAKSKGEWDEYYKQPHEVEKQKEFQKEKEKMRKELGV